MGRQFVNLFRLNRRRQLIPRRAAQQRNENMNALAQWNQSRWNQLSDSEDLQQTLRGLPSRPGVDWGEQHPGAPQRIPLVTARENARWYVLKTELPRVRQEDVKITIEGGTLTITGDRTFDLNRKKDSTAEHAYGRFAHSFAVPADARPAKVNAVFKNGVLTVHLAKSPVSISPPAFASCSFPTLRLNPRDQFNEPEREPKSSCRELCHIF